MIEALLGVTVGVLTIAIARLVRGQRWMYSLGLITLPSLYAFFALRAGEHALAGKEMLYGIPFVVAGLLVTFVSVRRSAIVIGVLWILHGAYDLAHGAMFTNPGVPDWYAVWCFCVDVVVGAYLLWLSRCLVDANLRHADVRVSEDRS